MFRGMEYIYAIWKEQSFSNAAKKLFISQPALSNSVKRVEPAKGLSSIKTQKVLNILEDKKGVGNQAHHRWTECIK